jgi:hypothetical protein
MVYRKLDVEFSFCTEKNRRIALFCPLFHYTGTSGTSPELREKYYRMEEHGDFEIGIADVGRLLVSVNTEENILLPLKNPKKNLNKKFIRRK